MGLGNMIKNLFVRGLKILSNLTCKISNVTCRSSCCVLETHGVEISNHVRSRSISDPVTPIDVTPPSPKELTKMQRDLAKKMKKRKLPDIPE